LVKFYTKGLAIDNIIEKRTNCSLFHEKVVEKGTGDLLKMQPIVKILVNLNFARINDVSINLITSVSFLRKVCPKSCIIFQALPLLILWLQYKESMYLLMCLFIFSLWNLLYFLLHQDEEMSAFRSVERERAN
jgi:hypothetical protein